MVAFFLSLLFLLFCFVLFLRIEKRGKEEDNTSLRVISRLVEPEGPITSGWSICMARGLITCEHANAEIVS